MAFARAGSASVGTIERELSFPEAIPGFLVVRVGSGGGFKVGHGGSGLVLFGQDLAQQAVGDGIVGIAIEFGLKLGGGGFEVALFPIDLTEAGVNARVARVGGERGFVFGRPRFGIARGLIVRPCRAWCGLRPS